MKKLSITLALLSAPLVTQAGESDDFCVRWHDFAYGIAEHRQNGTPMPDLMQAAMNMYDHPATRQLVLDAYSPKNPVMNGDKYRQKLLSEFANDAAAHCYSEGW